MKEIERAIEWFRLEHAQQEINYDSHPFKAKKDEDYIKVLETVLDCLQSELDRQEKNPIPHIFKGLPTSKLIQCCYADCDGCEHEKDCNENFDGYTEEVARRLKILVEMEENKALAEEDLENMIGEPVWVKGRGCYVVDKILPGQRNLRYLSACIYESDIPCIEAVKLGCYKHKPNGGE